MLNIAVRLTGYCKIGAIAMYIQGCFDGLAVVVLCGYV